MPVKREISKLRDYIREIFKNCPPIRRKTTRKKRYLSPISLGQQRAWNREIVNSTPAWFLCSYERILLKLLCSIAVLVTKMLCANSTGNSEAGLNTSGATFDHKRFPGSSGWRYSSTCKIRKPTWLECTTEGLLALSGVDALQGSGTPGWWGEFWKVNGRVLRGYAAVYFLYLYNSKQY